ncbi:hypothetical protein [Nocardioides bizhenqiangii]|uniref:Peptidase MA-like domain-containing protein n=1 Tax=Nocardioides bizhenqiangii TaxID=3095076 RepID=A0ABZ0ZNL8_9ACTN|nr:MULTISPECIES: hypothetical protein [unclassified Nocardioides]MDZ5620707.1 hypothetical protein [Nocardioides sp. HM23]WQQ25073.1 hypothetical protein SHK19_13975 [Nocardioides sp. HM61]
MRSALADPAPVRLLLAGVVLAVAALSGCQDDEPYVAPTPTASTDAIAPAAATRTLDDLERALRRRDADAAAELGADDAAQDLLRSVAETAAALDLVDVTFTYLTENGQVAADGSWTAAIATTWRIDGFDERSARADIEFAFADGGTRVGAIGGGVGRTPVWISGPAAVRRTDDVVVLVADGVVPMRPLVTVSEQALVVAQRVLGRSAEQLVIEVPASSDALHAALGQPPGTYDAVVAVTATADGANVPGAPVHVFINPDVYRAQGPLSAQVVLSHEAVHAVTATPTTSGVENWLLEGFADYVALRDVDLPVSRTAGQIIGQVRRDGVPEALPSRLDLDTRAQHLGAAYEASWLVCVTLAEHGGEDALVAFYEAVVDGAGLEAELRRHFGWTIGDLTRAWQDTLSSVSSVGG